MGAGEITKRLRARKTLTILGPAVLVIVALGAFAAYALSSSGDAPPAAVFEANVTQSGPVPLEEATSIPARVVTAAPTPSPVPTAPLSGQTFRLEIDKIGVNAPVVPEGMDENAVPIVPLNGYEVAWYDFTAQPGTPGNAVFAAHKTWAGEAVFYNLDDLQVGDVVRIIGDSDGTQLTYRVTDSFTVREDDPNGVQVMFPSPEDIVTIITCDGTRYYTGDPVFGHDYTERRVIRAIRDDSPQPAA
jgi:LPXTG-site transpeptidase (sortase) family protein